MDDEEVFSYERANLHQRIGELEHQVETMQIVRNDLNRASLAVAHEIEDLTFQQHAGRSQFVARVQVVVREAMRKMLMGETAWDASVQRAKEPITTT